MLDARRATSRVFGRIRFRPSSGEFRNRQNPIARENNRKNAAFERPGYVTHVVALIQVFHSRA
jgi:hypothetical protein